MYKSEYKVFRDNIHGYIKVPALFVKKLIDTELFQRLRYIEQTGMRTLYPSARHDRFIHSLGTYYLGVKAFEAFRENVKTYYSNHKEKERNHYLVFEDEKINDKFWSKAGILFSIACLLHDCGHAPFSHTLEFIYDLQKLDDGSSTSVLNNELLKTYGSASFKNDFSLKGMGKEHERMSALLVKNEFGNAIKEIIEEISGDWSEDDIEFIARSIIGCKYKSAVDNKQEQIQNCLIQLLNSSSIDVDGLDYIIRDSRLSGVDNVSVDVDRLINSLTIIEKTHFENYNLIDQSFDTVIINGKFNGKLNANIYGSIDVKNFNGVVKGHISISGAAKLVNKESIDLNGGFIKIGGVPYNKVPSPPPIEIEKIEADAEIVDNLELEDAAFKGTDKLNAEFCNSNDTTSFIMPSIYFEGSMNGLFSGDVLGYFGGPDRKVEVELAFHKNSLSVLQNVISARNYEYLWIYSHHKVAYYSNYLLIHLLRQSIKYLLPKKSPKSEADKVLTKILTMDKQCVFNKFIFRQANDSDLISLFKQSYLKNINSKNRDEALNRLYIEFFSRNYKKSIWKSYAEYNLFFKDLSHNERISLLSVIKDNTDSSGNTKLYGYFKDEWKKKFSEFGMEDVVWVNAEVTMKDLKPDETFIHLKDKQLRLKDVAIIDGLTKRIEVQLFYLYYSGDPDIIRKNCNGIIGFLKQKAKEKAKMLS